MTTDLLLPLLGTGGQVDHHPRCEVHVLEQRSAIEWLREPAQCDRSALSFLDSF